MDLRLERRKRDMKKYKTTIIITTLITLLPIVIGLFLWNKLPDTLATHWGSEAAAWIILSVITIGAIIPAAYSFYLYKKGI